MREYSECDPMEFLLQEIADIDWQTDALATRLSANALRIHLCLHGVTTEEKVRAGIDTAQDLLGQGLFTPALVSAASSAEVCLKDLLLSGLICGATLQHAWSSFLTRQLLGLRSEDLLRAVGSLLAAFEVDLGCVRLPSGEGFWKSWMERVRSSRNRLDFDNAKLETA